MLMRFENRDKKTVQINQLNISYLGTIQMAKQNIINIMTDND